MFRSLVRSSAFMLCVVALVGVEGVAAADAEDLRVAYVDLQKALANTKAGQRAQKSYEAEVKKAQAEIDRKREEYEVLRKSFDKQRDSLNEKARVEKEEDLVKMERDLKRSFKDSQEALRRKNTMIVADLLKQMQVAVDAIGKSEGFTLILEKSAQAVLYADNKIDITEQVVQKFDGMKQ